jgi:hypothetical protein
MSARTWKDWPFRSTAFPPEPQDQSDDSCDCEDTEPEDDRCPLCGKPVGSAA